MIIHRVMVPIDPNAVVCFQIGHIRRINALGGIAGRGGPAERILQAALIRGLPVTLQPVHRREKHQQHR